MNALEKHWTPEEYIQALELSVREMGIDLIGECKMLTRELKDIFPHLVRVWGWVDCDFHTQWPHWYLRDTDGTIYDPTRSQFKEVRGYGEWPQGEPVPHGRCYHCLSLNYGELVCQHCGRFARS